MVCKVVVKMDNAAFEDPGELPRLLREAARLVEARAGEHPLSGVLHDINGNTVGQVVISKG